MKSYHFAHKNRPFHLAQRDLCFEYAVLLLRRDTTDVSLEHLITRSNSITDLLISSEKHAYFMTQVEEATHKDEDLLSLIRLVQRGVNSMFAVLHHQECLRDEEGFLRRFLLADADKFVFSAQHYHRRFLDLRKGLLFLLDHAEGPCQRHLTATSEQMSNEDCERYHRAVESLRVELDVKYGE
jgi:hypothetical protein